MASLWNRTVGFETLMMFLLNRETSLLLCLCECERESQKVRKRQTERESRQCERESDSVCVRESRQTVCERVTDKQIVEGKKREN